jgi:hypothetical protein
MLFYKRSKDPDYIIRLKDIQLSDPDHDYVIEWCKDQLTIHQLIDDNYTCIDPECKNCNILEG